MVGVGLSTNLAATGDRGSAVVQVRVSYYSRFHWRAVAFRAAARHPRPRDSCGRFQFALHTRDSHVREECDASGTCKSRLMLLAVIHSGMRFQFKHDCP